MAPLRTVLVYATDADNSVIGLTHGTVLSLPCADIAALDNPRDIAQRIGEQNFGGNFRVIERVGKFQSDSADVLVFAGLTNVFNKNSAQISESNLGTVKPIQRSIVEQLLFPLKKAA